jgi:tetratricopeptide (TPR) repeat protein
MLRKLLLFTLLTAFTCPSILAQTTLDSVIAHGSVNQIIEELENNHSRYGDTENLQRQIAELSDQPVDYISNLATELNNRKAKFNQGYVSDETHALLERSGTYYQAGVYLQAVQFYVVADFMRRKEYVATEANLKSAIQDAEKFYNENNYAEAQKYIDQAEEIIAGNPIFVSSTVMKEYIIDLKSVRKKNRWMLTKGHATSFETMPGNFVIRLNFLYGAAMAGTSDVTMKHRPFGHRRTDVSHTMTFKDVEISGEYGLGLYVHYKITSALWLTSTARILPLLETSGTIEYPDQGAGETGYSFKTLLVDINLGATCYFYESEKLRFYGNAGAGVAQGFMREQDVIDNKIVGSLRFGDLYHVEDSYSQPLVSGAIGIDFIPFARVSYLNAEMQFGRYFDVQEAAPDTFFSISFGTGLYF